MDMNVTRPAEWGYDFGDVAAGNGDQLMCTPKDSVCRIEGQYAARPHNTTLHGDNCNQIMGDTVLEITRAGVVFHFPIPVWTFVAYISADTEDENRMSMLECFNGDDYIGGDQAHRPFGPAGSTIWTDFQYMVCMIYRTEFPGYEPKPITRAVFTPNGEGVYIGRLFAQV